MILLRIMLKYIYEYILIMQDQIRLVIDTINLDTIIKNITDISVFPIDNVTKDIIQCINKFQEKIKTKTNPDLKSFDESITNFYTNPSSGETYKKCYDNWIKDATNSCDLYIYFKNLNPDTYTNVVTEFNSLYNAVKETGDIPYSGYKVFIIIIMCIDSSRYIFRNCWWFQSW